MSYIFHIIILFEIYILLSISLNLVVGYNGFLSLAQAAFYGIGAYVSAFFIFNQFGFFPSIIFAAIAAAVISFIISIASLRFKGDIFIFVTLAFQILFITVVNAWINVTGGPYGLRGISRPNIFGSSLEELALLYGILVIVILLIMYLIQKSLFGLTLLSIRDNQLAALSLGKNIFSFRAKSFAISASLAAMAGGMYASYVTFISPVSFSLDESIIILSMVLVGGTGNVKGPIAGALVIVLLPEFLRFINIPDAYAPNLRLILYGLALVLMMHFRPRGIAGVYRFE